MKIFARVVLGILVLVAIGAGGLYLALYPRHYDADEFENIAVLAASANELRQTELQRDGARGMLAVENWPEALRALSPKEIRVYPTGVLVRLRGFFSFESGLYFPAPRVAEKIEERREPIYEHLGSGVYSYKVEG